MTRNPKLFGKTKIKPKVVNGDRVKINLKRIKSNRNYGSLLPNYRAFVEANVNTVFTAHIDEDTGFVNFVEDTTPNKWLFVADDLVKTRGANN